MSGRNRTQLRKPRKPKTKPFLSKAKGFLKSVLRKIRRLPVWADVFGILCAALVFYEIYRDLEPVVRPNPALSPSWADLPVTITNPGRFFRMHGAVIYCEISNITWKVKDNPLPDETKAFRATGIIERQVMEVERIEPGETLTFPCDSANGVVARLETGAQLPIALIHMRIKTKYLINLWVWKWHRESWSPQFTWRNVSGGFQWLEGDYNDSIK